MDLSYKENYWNILPLKAEFINFLSRIHRLDLSLWDKLGFWDQKYRPFSFFSGDLLVSNVCVYSMDMTIRGERCRVAQISAVGTLPEYRRKGLSLELTQKAMDWARNTHDFFFLFAEEDAYGFYKKSGFRQVAEYKARISAPGKIPPRGAIKLDIQRKDHLEQIYRLASNRAPVSDLLGVSNEKLLMFWCLYSLKDHIHYIPELDVLVLYKRDNGLITIFDVVGAHIPEFIEIYPYICGASDEAVEFLFMVDKLDLKDFDQIRVEGNGTHILGHFPLDGTPFIFPFTAHA